MSEALNRLLPDIEKMRPDDQDGVVEVGIALEKIVSGLDSGESATSALTLCLEALQAIYEGTTEDSDRAVAATAAVVRAASTHVAGDKALFEAGFELWLAIGRDKSDCPFALDSSEPVDLPSIDIINTFFIEADFSDVAGLSRLRDALSKLAADPSSYSPTAGQLLLGAAQRVEMIISGRAADPEAEIAEVRWLVQAAVISANPPAVEPAAEKTPEAQTADVLPPDADLALIAEFVTECREYIEGAEVALLALETDPDDMEAVNTVFRAFHTIKGTAAFIGFAGISAFAHRAESLLSRVRDKEIRLVGGYADLALRSVDVLRELMQSVQDALGGSAMVQPRQYSELMEVLADPESAGVSEESEVHVEEAPRLGDILAAQLGTSRETLEALAAEQGSSKIGEAVVKAGAASVADVAKALRTQKRMSSSHAAAGETSIRVSTERLDRLIDMVGELVIGQSMLAQDDSVIFGELYELARKVTHIGKIVRDIQFLSMSMRMVPLRPTFQKMARMVRDLARKCGKDVEFVTDGDDTEIDRNLVDVVNDPLVHMVRNAVDHGIESPDVRESSGKPRSGTVRLSAYHSGGSVVVELRDDGQGLSREKIAAKAVAKGLIESDKGMSDSEVFNLIFEPGFSTADTLTDLSGRGVGLDVVKKNVESARGRVEISSEPGKGCTFIMRLPLTLAVTDGMLVRVGEERFIIPTVCIHLSFQPTPEELSSVIGKGEMVLLRNELMPIFRLSRLFGIDGAIEDPTEGLLVVLDDGERRCTLLIDELLGQQHVVAKSLGDGIGRVPGISGAAILGDGRVGLILDAAGIIDIARHDSGDVYVLPRLAA